jgi:four helix bundle protein
MTELLIYDKSYNFAKWFFPVIERFPKHEKFALGSAMKNCIIKIQGLIIRANKTQYKLKILHEIDVRIEEMKFYIRFSHDRKYLSKKGYEYSSKLLAEIGRLLGGWIKSCKK